MCQCPKLTWKNLTSQGWQHNCQLATARQRTPHKHKYKVKNNISIWMCDMCVLWTHSDVHIWVFFDFVTLSLLLTVSRKQRCKLFWTFLRWLPLFQDQSSSAICPFMKFCPWMSESVTSCPSLDHRSQHWETLKLMAPYRHLLDRKCWELWKRFFSSCDHLRCFYLLLCGWRFRWFIFSTSAMLCSASNGGILPFISIKALMSPSREIKCCSLTLSEQ